MLKIIKIGLLIVLITLIFSIKNIYYHLQPKGIVLGLYSGIPNYDYSNELTKISKLGASCVSIQAIYFMENNTSCYIYRHPNSSPTEYALRKTFRTAKNNKLRILFFPTINIKNEACSAKWWRGNINPSNWDLWWKNYINFNVYLATIAQEEGVEWYSIGTEMTSTHTFSNQWYKLIDHVRHVFHGKIIYSINFDSHDSFNFGNYLDVIGINTYDPISKKIEHPPINQIHKHWWWIINKARTLQTRFNHPVMITEIGYQSTCCAHIGPWNFRSQATIDLELQDLLLSGAFDILKKWHDGEAIFYYLYGENLNKKPIGGINDRTYTVFGKPSEHTIQLFLETPLILKSCKDTYVERHQAMLQSLSDNIVKTKRYKKFILPSWVINWLNSNHNDKEEAIKIATNILIAKKNNIK